MLDTSGGGSAAPPPPPTSAWRRALPLAFALAILALLAFALAPRAHRRPRRRLALAPATVLLAAASSCSFFGFGNKSVWVHQETLYFHHGVAPGPVMMTREDATVFSERRYEPFGQPIDNFEELVGGGSQTGVIDFLAEPLNSLNKPTDPTTGFSYHGARWMASATARWLSPDPIVKAPDPKFMAEPWGLHPYQYVEQNPVLYWDPDGRNKDLLQMQLQSGKTPVEILSDLGIPDPQIASVAANPVRAAEMVEDIFFGDGDDGDSIAQMWARSVAEARDKSLFQAWRAGSAGALAALAPGPKGGKPGTVSFMGGKPRFLLRWNSGVKPLGRGSTVDPSKGRFHPRNLRERLAVDEAMKNPAAGVEAAGPLGDPRWPAGQGWVKYQQTVDPGGRGGPISVHYNYNKRTGAVDDFKVVERRPYVPAEDPKVPPTGE
jgi:RHS repeat-associated protein